MNHLAAAVLALLVVAPLVGQRVLHDHVLPPNSGVISFLRPAGDTNGDGVQDFVSLVRDNTVPGSPVFEVTVASGQDGTVLRTWNGFGTQSPLDAVGFGDATGDGRSDLAVLTPGLLHVYSGASGAALYAMPLPLSESYISVCELGDHDGNGTADLAVVVYSNSTGNSTIRLLKGENGGSLGSIAPIVNNHAQATLRSVGDVTGDGRQDLVLCTSDYFTYVVQTSPPSVLWTITASGNDVGRKVEAIDLDGDSKREVLFFRPQAPIGGGSLGRVEVYGGADGLLRYVVTPVPGASGGVGNAACAVGDLDMDGMTDFALATAGLEARSGRTGARLWLFPATPFTLLGPFLSAVGDVDGDGFGDLANSYDTGYGTAGWKILSGKILADTMPQTGACGGGPFFPRLGMTRPILGQTATVVGLDGPIGANGILAFSLRPTYPTYLGASSCIAFFDLGNAVALFATPLPQWTLQLPLPFVPQLAGWEVALQCFYSPTNGPLGYDLSNGLWARIGYQ